MISGFHHTGIVVQDLDKMVRFYTESLGLKVLLELDSIAPPQGDHTGVPGARRRLVFIGFEDDHQIELIHYIDPPAGEGHFHQHVLGAVHVCFNVDSLRETYATLAARGVRFVTEPKYKDGGGKRIGVVYACDPEGNWLEFIEGW